MIHLAHDLTHPYAMQALHNNAIIGAPLAYSCVYAQACSRQYYAVLISSHPRTPFSYRDRIRLNDRLYDAYAINQPGHLKDAVNVPVL